MIGNAGINTGILKRGFFVVLTFSMFQISWLSARAHPLHVSVTEIDYNQSEKEFEIMIRFFIQDLEKAIRQQRHQMDINLLNPGGDLTIEKLISAYLEDHIKITLKGKGYPIKYLGQELEGEAVICYAQVSHVDSWKSCEVTNDALQELYDDQSNIVHVTVGGRIKGQRLVKDNPRGVFSFEY
jgi:Domain of unknown function (DUF6702)